MKQRSDWWRGRFIWGQPGKENIHLMFDMEQHPFCTILDKMNHFIQMENNTQVRISTQLFCAPPRVQIFLGKVPPFQDNKGFECSADSGQVWNINREPPLLSRQESHAGLDGAAGFTGGGWLEMAEAKFKWTDPNRESGDSYGSFPVDHVFATQTLFYVRGEQRASCLITYFQ